MSKSIDEILDKKIERMERIAHFFGGFEKEDDAHTYELLKELREYRQLKAAGLLAKVVHGEWIVTDEGVFVNQNTWRPERKYSYNCLVCRYHTGNQGKYFKYCPNCGAKMDGKEEGVKND